METQEAIRTRRTVKKYKDKPLSKEMVGLLLEAGRMAPSSGNLQNWRFIVIDNPQRKQLVAKLCATQHWMETAPVLIAIVGILDKARIMFGERGEKFYTVQNCACAAQNMMLLAQSMGLGSGMVSVFDEEEMGHLLNLPDNVQLQSIVAFGYPDENPDVPVRHELDTLVFFDKYGNRIVDMDDTMGEYGGAVRSTIEKTTGAVDNVNKKVEQESKGIFDTIKKFLKQR